MMQNKVTSYIDPNSADVWIMEEPTKRGAGQVNRVIEQNRSAFNDELNPKAAAETHSVYRTDEFLRFRKPLRENNKIIINKAANNRIKNFLGLTIFITYDIIINQTECVCLNSPRSEWFILRQSQPAQSSGEQT